MSDNETVSVILPTYNRAHVIREAIQSVLDQTYADFELLIIDDGSTDGTRGAVESFSDARIQYHFIDHRGVSFARNHAMKTMRGRYAAFIDSDDVYKPEKLKSQVEYLKSHPKAMVAYSPYIEIKDGRETFHSCDHGNGNVFLEMFKSSFINVNTILIRRECVDAVGGFPENYRILEDYDLFLRLAEKYEFGFVNVTSSCYRMSKRDNTQDTENYVLYMDFIRKCYEDYQILKDNPKVYRWKYGKVLYGLGKSHFRAGRYEEARRYIRESLKYRWQPDVVMFLIKNRKKFKA